MVCVPTVNKKLCNGSENVSHWKWEMILGQPRCFGWQVEKNKEIPKNKVESCGDVCKKYVLLQN